MNKKTLKKINGGISIYYGISAAIGALFGLIGTGTWLFKVFADQTDFSWGTLAGLIITTGVMAVMGYCILRVGYEEIEK